MRLRQGRVVDGPIVLRSVGETDLLGEDRLPRPRGAGDHNQRSDRHSPAEDTVELRVPRLKTFHHEPPASDSTRSTISEFENGFRITTSAPVAPFGFAVSIRTGIEAVLGSALRFSRNSRPSITGIIRPVTRTLGRSCRRSFSA